MPISALGQLVRRREFRPTQAGRLPDQGQGFLGSRGNRNLAVIEGAAAHLRLQPKARKGADGTATKPPRLGQPLKQNSRGVPTLLRAPFLSPALGLWQPWLRPPEVGENGSEQPQVDRVEFDTLRHQGGRAEGAKWWVFFISAVVRASLTGLPISGHELHRDGGEGGLFLTRRHRAATRWLC